MPGCRIADSASARTGLYRRRVEDRTARLVASVRGRSQAKHQTIRHSSPVPRQGPAGRHRSDANRGQLPTPAIAAWSVALHCQCSNGLRCRRRRRERTRERCHIRRCRQIGAGRWSSNWSRSDSTWRQFSRPSISMFTRRAAPASAPPANAGRSRFDAVFASTWLPLGVDVDPSCWQVCPARTAQADLIGRHDAAVRLR